MTKNRHKVVALLREGKSYEEISREVGLRKSTISYYASTNGLARQPRKANRYDWQEVQSYHDAGNSFAACMRRFGFAKLAWEKACRRGDIRPRTKEPYKISDYKDRAGLRQRLRKDGLGHKCERCGIDSWQGQPLSMHLHHKNGDGKDNRMENIEFLCPNCHSQTETYGGRNVRLKSLKAAGEGTNQ